MADDFIIRRYVLAIIVFTFIIVGGTGIIKDYVLVDPRIAEGVDVAKFYSMDKSEELNKSIVTLQTAVDGSGTSKDKTDYFNVLWSIAVVLFAQLKNIFVNFGFAFTVMGTGVAMFGIPAWVLTFVLMALSTLIIFALISFVIGRNT